MMYTASAAVPTKSNGASLCDSLVTGSMTATTSKYVSPSFGLCLIALQRTTDKTLAGGKQETKLICFCGSGGKNAVQYNLSAHLEYQNKL